MSRAEIAESSSPLDFLFFPFKLVWGFIVFMIFAWTTSRQVRPFILSFPAALGLIAFIAAAWVAEFKGRTVGAVRSFGAYTEMSDEASPFYNLSEAVGYVRKASNLTPLEPAFKYELGLAHERLADERPEELDRAYDVISWLAPSRDDKDAVNYGDGFSDGHLWMASYHWNDESKSEEVRRRNAREHMELSYDTNNENVYAVLGLASMNRAEADELRTEIETLKEEGADQAAIEYKEREEETRADRAVELYRQGINLPLRSERQLYASLAIIEMLQARGEDAKAKQMGRQFIIKHEKNAHLYPDALPFWISIVRTCMLIDDYEKANEFILKGYQLANNLQVRQILAQLAAQIKVEESKTFEDMESETEFIKRLFALCTAIKTNVQVMQAYRELVYFVDDVESGSDQEFWMRGAILGSDVIDAEEQKDPRFPGIIHMVLGFREIVQGRKTNGLEHWEIASQQFDMAPHAINFMIQIYSGENELSRKKKLHLANCGITRFPQSPYFYATRGRFNLDEGFNEEAADDMRFANSRIPGNINILENLLAALKKVEEGSGEKDGLDDEIRQVESELADIRSKIAVPVGDKLSNFVQADIPDYTSDDDSESE